MPEHRLGTERRSAPPSDMSVAIVSRSFQLTKALATRKATIAKPTKTTKRTDR